MTNTERWLELDEKHLASVLPRYNDIVAIKGEGSWLIDADHNRYLDLGSGIATNSTGHCHRDVVLAIMNQATQLIHTSVTAHNTLNIQLAERLGKLTHFEEPQVFFSNSGAEAVDGSLKLARQVSGQSGVIAFQGSFHGRTIAATSLTTSKGKYRKGYSPFLPYVFHAPYGEHIDVVEEIMACGPPRFPYKIGAVIVEPILGEGGYIVPSREWLLRLRDLCDSRGALLIFDEVQTGIFRTGFPFAAEFFGVKPDVILFAKGVASGLPLGGIIAEKETMRYWPEGTHGSTFGGNPVSCAAALATLNVLEPLADRIKIAGANTRMRLAAQQPYPVRGAGLMIGIEFPDGKTAKTIANNCLDKGVIVLTCGKEDQVIRLVPPLTISDEELNYGLNILIGEINAVSKAE